MKYVVRTENGDTFTSTEWGKNNGKEIIYKTYEDAAKAKEELQPSLKDVMVEVIEVK